MRICENNYLTVFWIYYKGNSTMRDFFVLSIKTLNSVFANVGRRTPSKCVFVNFRRIKLERDKMFTNLLDEFCFPSIFLRYLPRQAFIVYRLIYAIVIGIFSMIPSYFKIEIFTKICCSWITHIMQQK